jgi:flagellar hook-associated protein 3 FlgL
MSTPSFARLGSANAYDNALRNISQRQTALSGLQDNLTSGKRVVRASDDPTSAAQAERALTRLSRIATDQRALASQTNSIAMAESTLGDVTKALQSFRGLVVSAGSGAFTQKDRQTVTQQLQGLRDQVFNLSNQKDTNGQSLFSALGSALTPFVGATAEPQDYTFNGLPGQAASGTVSIPFALDGDSAFMLQTARDGVFNIQLSSASTLRTDAVVVKDATLLTPGSSYSISAISITADGATGTSYATYNVTETPAVGPAVTTPLQRGPDYATIGGSIAINLPLTAVPLSPPAATPSAPPGLTFNIIGAPTGTDSITVSASPSLFSVLDDAIRDIGRATTSSAANQAVSQALGNIDISMNRVSTVRGHAGELLNRADRISDNQSKRSMQVENDRSRAEDTDMLKAFADFQNQQTGYQVALQSYAQIQKLSLFNYIS